MSYPTGRPSLRPLSEGWQLLLALAGVHLVLFWLLRRRVVAGAFALSALLLALAFRDPERAIERRPRTALAPADGRVIHVQQVLDDYWQCQMIEIGIFLALWDVHIQRFPLDGEVVARRHRPGGYGPAMLPAASHDNNQVATYLRTPAGPCVVTQISGIAARRIVSWVEPGTTVEQGYRLGMIKFGSQTTLRVPATATPLVQVGDKARAGITPLALLAGD